MTQKSRLQLTIQLKSGSLLTTEPIEVDEDEIESKYDAINDTLTQSKMNGTPFCLRDSKGIAYVFVEEVSCVVVRELHNESTKDEE